MGKSRQASDRAWQATRKNLIINGNFDVWQRATSQTASGYGSEDRWVNFVTGSSQVHSRQTFGLGQTNVPNNPKYFARTVVTHAVGASNGTTKWQSVEGVESASGKIVTMSFWAKADSSKNIATECVQHFGAGGSPSANVTSIGVTTHNLTTSWQRFITTFTMPSIAGKTKGTDGDDRLAVNFWFEGGSNHNARNDSLGQQSGTFDIAQVQFEIGDQATDFEQRSIAEEMMLCQRYYLRVYGAANFPSIPGQGFNATLGGLFWEFPTEMRAAPTIGNNLTAVSGIMTATGGLSVFSSMSTINSNSSRAFLRVVTTGGMAAGNASGGLFSSGEYIDADAEL